MDAVDKALHKHGLLLQQDKRVPSVVGIIAGGALRGSWWSHPKAQEIFARLQRLDDDEDVLVSRLVAGKVTYVHRKLWPAFLAVATSNAAWQDDGLSAEARTLLARAPVRAKGDAIRELQERLLVAAAEVHTEAGRHEIEIEPWDAWARRHRAAPMQDIDAAREELERAVIAIGAPLSSLRWRKRTS